MNLKMIYDTLKILDSAFLLFASAFFLRGTIINIHDANKAVGSGISAVAMTLAIIFMWR